MSKTKKPAELINVDERSLDQRIDNFLMGYLKNIPRSLIYKLLRTGQVRVNKGRIKSGYRLKSGDVIRVPPYFTGISGSSKSDKEIPVSFLAALKDAVLYENKDILVINKPAGIPVHAGSGIRFGVIEILRQLNPGYDFLELVHRLDKSTSGCLLLAKNRKSLNSLHELIRNHSFNKTYHALLKGCLPETHVKINAQLAMDKLISGERMVVVEEGGKDAETSLVLIEQYRMSCLVEINIKTGRKHQIRVHTAHIGHPVAGDYKYGDNPFNVKLKQLGLKRMFLHASSLCFELEKIIKVEAPLPGDLASIINKL